MMSSPTARVIIDRKPHPLYPNKEPPIRIDGAIRIFGGKKDYTFNYMDNGLITERCNGLLMYQEKVLRQKRRLHKLQFVDQLPSCKCRDQNRCWYYQQGLCQRFTDFIKTKQTYIGKKKMMRVSKPKLNYADLIRTPLKVKVKKRKVNIAPEILSGLRRIR